MREDSHRINPSVVEEIEHYPMPDLIRSLFPGHQVRERGVMSSPLREDRNPSFSCFRGHGGVWLGKDLAQDVTYNNISLYRAAFGGTFDEAVEALSQMLFSRTAVQEATVRREAAVRLSGRKAPKAEAVPVLQVLGVHALNDVRTPSQERDYWRGRGISDENICSLCSGVEYLNTKMVGKTLLSPVTNLPVYDKVGIEMKDDGRRWAVGLRNEIGGWTLRSADSSVSRGFKGCTSSFFTLIPSGGFRPASCVSLMGQGDGRLESFVPDYQKGLLYINGSQYFSGLAPHVMPYAAAFLHTLRLESLDSREVNCLCGLFSSMNRPLSGRFAVVEGMYDALSFRQIQSMEGKDFSGGVDIVVLNSTSNVHWAAPLLAMGREVRLYMDNDLRSGAGKKAAEKLSSEIGMIASFGFVAPKISDGTALFAPSKDLNAALVASLRRNAPKATAASSKEKSSSKKTSFVKHI